MAKVTPQVETSILTPGGVQGAVPTPVPLLILPTLDKNTPQPYFHIFIFHMKIIFSKGSDPAVDFWQLERLEAKSADSHGVEKTFPKLILTEGSRGTPVKYPHPTALTRLPGHRFGCYLLGKVCEYIISTHFEV